MTLLPNKGSLTVGDETLEMFAHAERFNKWMFDAVAPYCKGNMLEIGSGIGNLSIQLIDQASSLTVSDMNEEYLGILQQRLSGDHRLKAIHQIDLGAKDFTQRHSALLGQFDTVIALNVVEHIEDDTLALENCRKLLKEDGSVVILVPAFQALYNSLDKELQHFRRYSRKGLLQLMKEQQLNVQATRYFNAVGIAGWWCSGTLLKRSIISKRQLTIYNKLVPFFRLIDNFTKRLLGLSIIVVASPQGFKN